MKKLIFFIQTILNRKNRFAPELLEGLNSVSHSKVRWSRRLMKISDRMKLDIPTQKAIYLVGMDYIKKEASTSGRNTAFARYLGKRYENYADSARP